MDILKPFSSVVLYGNKLLADFLWAPKIIPNGNSGDRSLIHEYFIDSQNAV